MNDQVLRLDVPHVFMIVPFHERHKNSQQAIRKAAASLGLACLRTDDVHVSTSIVDRALRGIASATVVVADLTDSRPNCYYELGYADALKRPVVLIANEKQKLSFDISERSICRYKTASDLVLNLPKWLIATALVNRAEATKFDMNAGRFGGSALVGDYLLSAHATVEPPNSKGKVWSWVSASVRRIDRKPLPGNPRVKFFLDPDTFEDSVQKAEIVNGVAQYSFSCYGAFTLGAQVGSVSLELDLRNIPGATDLFRSL
jgi:hypothetical protein